MRKRDGMADFENNSEIDIQDLEARLYGQIYHSTLSEDFGMESRHHSRNYELNRLNDKKSKRYYENPDINVTPQAYQPNRFTDLGNSNPIDDQKNGMLPNFCNHQNNIYNYQNPAYNDSYSNACQQFVLPGSPGINNILVIPPAPTQYFSTAFHPLFNKTNKKKRNKQKKKLKPYNSTRSPFREHRKDNRTLTLITEQSQTNKSRSCSETKSTSNVNVVVLSDSDNSDVEEVILDNTVIDISSSEDDEDLVESLEEEKCNSKAKKEDIETSEVIQVKEEHQDTKKSENLALLDNEDDVIVLAEEPVEQEIIEVEDTKDSDVTITTEEKSHTTEEVSATPHDKNELNTLVLDSTNDFLDAVELSQNNFNFQLHGSDFYFSKSTTQLKSSANNEASETESSCSTVDIPIKSSALSDVTFDIPCKEVFDEPNLETFANFITPKRKLDANVTSESAKPKRKKSTSPKTKPLEIEKDLNDQEKKLKKKKKSKVIELEAEEEEKSSKKKKKEKSKEHCDENCELLDVENENDSSVIPLESSEMGTPKPKKKKKRKNDKKEESTNSIIDHNRETLKTANSGNKRKRKNNQINETSDSNTLESDLNATKEHRSVSVEFTNDSDSDNSSVYTVDYESDNNSNSNLSFRTIAETGTARDKGDDDDSFDDFGSISDVGEDVEIVNVNIIQKENYPREKAEARPERKQFSDFWNNDMEKFYGESWGHENFSVSESQKSMSDDPNVWKILDCDRYLYFRPRGPRCRWCRQWGHVTYRCPNKSNYLVCSLCGNKGHMEPRCPNKICTSCGQQMNYFTTYCTKCKGFMNVVCIVCNMRGHPTRLCPDLWRRYHLTTKEGPVVTPEDDFVKPFHKRWCSGCGSQGHFEHDCKYYNRTHSATLFAVQSYEPVYDPIMKSPVKRKQENEDGLSKKKQLKTTHHQINKNKSNSNELRKSREEQEKSHKETGSKSKEETVAKSKNTNKKEQGKEKTTAKSKELETSKSRDKINKEEETSKFQEENQGEILLNNNETYRHQNTNQLELTEKSKEKNDGQEEVNKQEKMNNSQGEVSASTEENQNSNSDVTVKQKVENAEGRNLEKSECTIKQEATINYPDGMLQDNEVTIVDEEITLHEKSQLEIEQTGTLTYNKKLEEFAKNIKEIYKGKESPQNKKKKKNKGAKSQNNSSQSKQKTKSQSKKNKNKKKQMYEPPQVRPGSLLGDPVGSQFLINPWATMLPSVLPPQMYFSSGSTQNLQNHNFYGSPFHANNYQLPFHTNIQDLFSGNSIFSSPAFLHANPFMQQNMRQFQPNIGQIQQNTGQIQPNMGPEQPNINSIQLFQRNNEREETATQTSSNDLSKSDGKIAGLTEVNDPTKKLEGIDLTKTQTDDASDDDFNIHFSSSEYAIINKLHGRIFMRDMCTIYRMTYEFRDKRTMTLSGRLDESTFDRIKAKIIRYINFNRSVSGFIPLPKTFSDAQEIFKQYVELLWPLERLNRNFVQLERLSKIPRSLQAVRKMNVKIANINRVLIGKLYLKEGQKHLDFLKMRLLTQSNEFSGNEWNYVNESFNYVFQNDKSDLLCVEFLSNLPTSLVPRSLNNSIWKSCPKGDRNSMHFILNNRKAFNCVKKLFCFLDKNRQTRGKNGDVRNKKQKRKEKKRLA